MPTLLPSELWFIVFDLATFTPRCFDPEVADNFTRPNPDYEMGTFMFDMDNDLRTVREALATKRAISQVCRSWHELVKPLLYEVLSLVRIPNVAPLAAQITGSPGIQLDCSFGRYTRRLDIALPYKSFPAIEDTLRRLIEHLPLLEVSIIHGRDMSLGMIKSLAETCTATIRKLVWENEGLLSDKYAENDLQHLYDLISNSRRLVTLLTTRIGIFGTDQYLAITDIAAATSRTFSFPMVNPQDQRDVVHHRPGYALVSFLYNFPILAGDTVFVQYPIHASSRHIERLPGIRKAILYISRSNVLTSRAAGNLPFVLPSGVTHIGLHFGFTQAESRVYGAIRTLLYRITELGYTPQVVRFLDEQIVADLRREHQEELRRMHDGDWLFSTLR